MAVCKVEPSLIWSGIEWYRINRERRKKREGEGGEKIREKVRKGEKGKRRKALEKEIL